jgi:hypothetical protein
MSKECLRNALAKPNGAFATGTGPANLDGRFRSFLCFPDVLSFIVGVGRLACANDQDVEAQIVVAAYRNQENTRRRVSTLFSCIDSFS